MDSYKINSNAKLSLEQVQWIRANIPPIRPGRQRLRRHANIVLAMAEKFGVTKETIWNVVSGRTWPQPPKG